MGHKDDDSLERRIWALAVGFCYPPTPDVAGFLRQGDVTHASRSVGVRRLAQALIVTLLALALFMAAVPQARAAVAQALRLGAIRILLGGSTPDPSRLTDGETAPAASGEALDLAGETSLEEAAGSVPFAVQFPAYPADLGPPDKVFLQHSGGAIVILVWRRPSPDNGVRMSLYLVESGAFITKQEPPVIRRTLVNGQPGIWTEGSHFLQVKSSGYQSRQLVEGHVLIWMGDGVTYRLETDLPLEEAVKVAESLG